MNAEIRALFSKNTATVAPKDKAFVILIMIEKDNRPFFKKVGNVYRVN